jgi:hypothetical protein
MNDMRTSTATLQTIFIALLFSIVSNSAFSQGNLVAYFPFDGNIIDVSSSPNLAQSQGITYCPDRFGQVNSAVRFDASPDRILVPQTTFNVNALDAITISFWMRREVFDFPGYNPHLAVIGDRDLNNYALAVDVEYARNVNTPQFRDLLFFYNYSSFNNFTELTHPNPIANSSWHHCAYVVNRITRKTELFVDGIGSGQLDYIYNPVTLNYMSIGNHPMLNWAFLGDLDEFRIHDRALSQSEITTLMNGSSATTCANNLLANPSFANHLANWNGTGGTWQTGNLELCQTGQLAYQTVAAQAGQNYQFHYTAKTAGTNQNVLFGLKFLSSTWNVLATNYSSFDSPTGFTSNFIEKLAPAGTAWVEVSIAKQNSGCVQVSEVCLTKDGGTPNPCSNDVTPPVISACPQSITISSTAPNPTWTAPTATDNCPGAVTVTGSAASGQAFAVGATTVTYTARDAANNTSTCSFVITVQAPPTGGGCINNLLQNASFDNNLNNWNGTGSTTQNGNLELCQIGDLRYQTVAAEAGKTYQFHYTAKTAGSNQNVLFGLKFLSSSWNVLGSEYSSFDSPGAFGSNFIQKVAPVGTTWVEVSIAKQNSGCVQVSEVCLTKDGGTPNPCTNDVTPPIISACPQSITISSTAPNPTWAAPTATDNCSGALPMTSTHSSGQQFAVGATTVTYTARDAAQNTSTCSFVVTVTQGIGNPNCSIMATFPWQDWISEVKVNNALNTSGKAQYTNYTTPVFTAARGVATAIELTTSFSYFTYDEYYRVWIDFNQDNIYQANEIAYQGIMTRPADGTASKKLTGTFTVPTSAMLGNTKMRIIMRRGAYPVDACTNIVEGEVEDYSFHIAVQALQSSGGNAVVETDPFNEVLIYPNPATQQAFIDLNVLKGAPTIIRIFDAFGKLHHSALATTAVYGLNLIGWESGVYMVRLETEGARARVMKLVVVGL